MGSPVSKKTIVPQPPPRTGEVEAHDASPRERAPFLSDELSAARQLLGHKRRRQELADLLDVIETQLDRAIARLPHSRRGF